MNLIAQFFIARGMSKGPEIVAIAVRHGMTALGGFILAHPVIVDGVSQPVFSAENWNTVTAAALIIGGAAWSIARTFLAPKLGLGK